MAALATLSARAQTYPTILQSQSPADFWRFNETTPSAPLNTISNLGSAGAAGTGYVVQAITGAPGIVGNCIQFTNNGQAIGACFSRIDIPNQTALNPRPPFTIEFWAKPNSPFAPSGDGTPPTGVSPISSVSLPGSGSFEGARLGYIFYANPGGWQFRVGGIQSYTATAIVNQPVATNAWTHVVGEFDGATLSLYLNGALAGSSPVSGGPFQPNTFMPTRIGGTSLPGSEYEDGSGSAVEGEGNRGWDGWVDEFAIYNTLLSSNTIASHYSTAMSNPAGYDALVLASSPVGYWNFDEPAYTAPVPDNGTFAADSGLDVDNGTNTPGTLIDQPGVPGTGDKSVFYSGSAGSLAVDPSVTNLDNVGGETLTLVAWIKPQTFGYISDIIAQGYDETTYAENFLRVGTAFDWAYFQDDASGGNANPAVVPDVEFYEIGAYDGGPNYVSAVFPAPAGDIGNWVFLAGTFDGTNWNLYRDANLVAQFPGTWDDGNPSGPADIGIPWAVGSRSNPNPYFGMFFSGSIAEASILTNALDAGTISNLYNSSTLPPVITQAPVAPSPAYLGSSATFSVWADGPGTLSYQWFSNSAAINGQTATNLSLIGLTASDNATYSVVVTNAHGAVTSSVVLAVTPTLPPATLIPATETRWIGFPLRFAPSSLPSQQLTFQWYLDGHAVGGATDSSYTAPALSGTAGSYTLVLSNILGSATSSVATLSLIIPPNLYVSTILTDSPVAFLRLDETSGTIAYDYAGGNNGSYIGGLKFGVPGYSLVDTDTAVSFPGIAESYVGGIGPSNINFAGTASEFSVEAWANGAAGQIATDTGAAVIAKGHGNNGTTADEQFAITDDAGVYAFFVRDDKGNAATATATTGPDGNWHHLVGVCDEAGGSITLYIDGAVAASAGLSGLDANGIINSQNAVTIGSESSEPGPSFDLAYDGTISQVAIYATNLTADQVMAHYAAAYGPSLAPFVTTQPLSATNYVNLPVSFTVGAAGTVPLTYQWNKVGSGPISGATLNTFSIANLALTDAGTYNCGITNPVGGILSSNFIITVLPAPTTPLAIGGLVMHLTFDGNLTDATGRGNDATNEASGGATLITNDYVPGEIGQAFTYQTTLDDTNVMANYASIGVRPDLQFGSNSFTVSMWVQLPENYIGNDLPFFTDVPGSTFGFPGYVFEPTFGTTEGSTAGWAGGWGFSVYDSADVGEGVYGDRGLINDGGWHNLVYVIDRVKGAAIYLDGIVAHQNIQEGASVVGIGNINSTNAATIGQDPTGLYPQSSDGNISIDDLGVWNRALTPLEVAGIYTAGAITQVSFVGVTNVVSTITLSAANLNNGKVELDWSAGTLEAATNLLGPWMTLTNVTSPFTTNTVGPMQFFRVEQ
jgi:hypothetical protein